MTTSTSGAKGRRGRREGLEGKREGFRLPFAKSSAGKPAPTGAALQVNAERQERLSTGNGSGGNANDMQKHKLSPC